MKRLQGILGVDGPNLSDIIILPRAFPGALWDGCRYGFPSHLSHDWTQLVGWARPTAVLLEPGCTRLLGIIELPESPEEERLVQEWARAAQHEIYKQTSDKTKQLRELLRHSASVDAAHCFAGCFALYEKGLAARVFPDLFRKVLEDKDGLISLDSLQCIGPGVFRKGEFALFAHAYFRRSFTRLNSLNAPFLTRLNTLQERGIAVKIALDPDLVGLASTYAESLEFEYWWGPKFDEKLANIPTGVSKYVATEIDRMFYGLSHTEFWWHSRDSLHTLEAEEVRDRLVTTEDPTTPGYLCRYVHCIVDETSGKVLHFDGAVRGYDEDGIILRLGADIQKFGRGTAYTKLWRTDSDLNISEWKALLSDYYRDNRLVGEYLGAEPAERYGQVSREEDETAAGNGIQVVDLVPHFLKSGDGIRLALTFHPPHSPDNFKRRAIAQKYFEFNAVKVDIYEEATLELKKVLEQRGEHMQMSPQFAVSHTKDLNLDFGMIAHGSSASEDPQILVDTLSGIRALVDAWKAQSVFRCIAYSLVFRLEDRDACVSIVGHVDDVSAWLANHLCIPPTNREDLAIWVENVSTYLGTSFPPAPSHSSILPAAVQFSGSLMQRQGVDNIEFIKDGGGIRWQLNMDDVERIAGLKEALERGDVTPALCLTVTKSTCTKCDKEYSSCPCCKTLEEGVAERIEMTRGLDAVWSHASLVNQPIE